MTIVVADSRGRHLDMYVDHDDIKVSFQSGARLVNLAWKAVEIIDAHKPDIILLMGGINDVTIRNKYTGRVRLISTSATIIVSHLMQQINQAKSIILASHPEVRVVIGGIMGIHISTYNRRHLTSPLQPVIDHAMISVNAYIKQLNEDAGLPHPRLTSKLYTWKRGIRKNHYHRLYDGLHPGELILENWGRHIRIFHDKCVDRLSSL